MAVVAEGNVRQVELAAALDVDLVRPVHHHFGDILVGQQRLERPQPHHVVDEVGDEALLLDLVEADLLLGEQLGDEAADLRHQLVAGQAGGGCGVDALHHERSDRIRRLAHARHAGRADLGAAVVVRIRRRAIRAAVAMAPGRRRVAAVRGGVAVRAGLRRRALRLRAMHLRRRAGEGRHQRRDEIALLQEVQIETHGRGIAGHDHANLLRQRAARQLRDHLLVYVRLDYRAESLQRECEALLPAFSIRKSQDALFAHLRHQLFFFSTFWRSPTTESTIVVRVLPTAFPPPAIADMAFPPFAASAASFGSYGMT